MIQTITKLPDCKKKYSKSRNLIVCENGEIYTPFQGDYRMLKVTKRGSIAQIYYRHASYNVAKEVWHAFKGEKPNSMDYIIHIDGNVYNNALDNLKLITRAEWYNLNGKGRRRVKNKETGEIYPSIKYVANLENTNCATMRNTLMGFFELCIHPEWRRKYEIID